VKEKKMKKPFLFSLIVALALASFLAHSPARADGIIIPDPPPCSIETCPPVPMDTLSIRYHHVTVTIEDQVAVTHVDQVFYNPNDWTVEGTYIFPIPTDAAVSSFTLWIDGQPVEGKVLDAAQARQTYEEIVRTMRDPALLEYADRGAVQARIFPIAPQGERRIELEYTQALAADNGLVRYVYPLSTEKFSSQPLESVSISIDIRSSTPLRAAYSPTHPVSVTRDGETHLTAGYEEANVTPNTDFALYYSLGETEAFHLLTYRDPSDTADPGGFFLLLLAPKPEVDTQPMPKDVILVLDQSGSMEGEKFTQAQQAAKYILSHLNPEDMFNVITFSTGVQVYAPGLVSAEGAKEAASWVDAQSAQGSTDINRALLEAASMTSENRSKERPAYLIFLTDGLPTEGETDPARILANFASAPAGLRLFAFGVGYDVDTYLLDSLAQEHHGASFYVTPGENLEEVLSSFYQKISTPVLTDIQLDFGDITVSDIYPHPLPDMFVGSQIVVVGRYKDPGTTDVTVSGKVNGQAQTFVYHDQVFASRSSSDTGTLTALPRLWATRKIGYLLNQVRLNGADQETIDQIVKLSIRYGIVTPYTSYLVTEDMPLGAEEQQRIADEQYSSMQAAPSAPASGQAAVERAAGQSDLAGAESVAAPPAEAADVVKIVGSRTFVLSDGIWTDTAFDPQTMQTVKVSFLSQDYFDLSASNPELAAAFALEERVIALSGGTAYEVVSDGTPVDPLQITPTGPVLPDNPSPTDIVVNNPPAEKDPSGSCLGGLVPLGLAAGGIVLGLRKKNIK
jgi:Ca-activated chloride channel family protein